MTEEYILVVFDSTHFAIKSESEIKKNKISCRLIPTPGNIKAGCGLTMKIEVKDLELVIKTLREEKIEFEGIYHITVLGKESKIRKIDK